MSPPPLNPSAPNAPWAGGSNTNQDAGQAARLRMQNGDPYPKPKPDYLKLRKKRIRMTVAFGIGTGLFAAGAIADIIGGWQVSPVPSEILAGAAGLIALYQAVQIKVLSKKIKT
jgi:hypothetical protein